MSDLVRRYNNNTPLNYEDDFENATQFNKLGTLLKAVVPT